MAYAIYSILENKLIGLIFLLVSVVSDEIKRQFENAGVKMIITVELLMDVAQTVAAHLPDYKSTICIGGEDDLSKNVHGLQSLLTGKVYNFKQCRLCEFYNIFSRT